MDDDESDKSMTLDESAQLFRAMWHRAHPRITADKQLCRYLDKMRITNIVATFNLNVRHLNLHEIASRHSFCNYHKGTFAAMSIRLTTPTCSALVYPVGVVVCMATKSDMATWLAATKYTMHLNRVGIRCRLMGLKTDNYVLTVHTFPLDLPRIDKRWTAVIEYAPEKFPGAIIRCKYMTLPFETNVHIAAFLSGKFNVTGARSIYEAYYVFVLAYYEYFIKLRRTSVLAHRPLAAASAAAAAAAAAKKANTAPAAAAAGAKTDNSRPSSNKGGLGGAGRPPDDATGRVHVSTLKYMHRFSERPEVKSVSRAEDGPAMKRTITYVNGDVEIMDVSDMRDMQPHEIDRVMHIATSSHY